jgi:hypothetical protein
LRQVDQLRVESVALEISLELVMSQARQVADRSRDSADCVLLATAAVGSGLAALGMLLIR